MDKQQLPQNYGRYGTWLVDIAAIVTAIFISPFFFNRTDALFGASFSDDPAAVATLAALMLVIIFGRLFGLYLKSFSPNPSGRHLSGPMFFFNFPVIVLTGAFASLIVVWMLGQTGLFELNAEGFIKDDGVVMLVGVTAIIGFVLAEAVLLYRLTKPVPEPAGSGLLYGLPVQMMADFGLFAYLMVWHGFYNYLASILLTSPTDKPYSTEMKIVSIVISALSFCFFYVAPRMVLTSRERRGYLTYAMIFLVFLVSVLRHW